MQQTRSCTKVGTTIEIDVKEELSKTIKIFAKNLRKYYQNIIENQSKNAQKLVLETSREALGGARRPIPHQGGGTGFFWTGGICFLEASWGRLGAVLEPLGAVLAIWAASGACHGPVLGPVLGCPGLSWPVLGCLGLS